MHGLCLLLFPGTVPEFVTPLFPSQATQHPWFSRLPSFHAPAFPPPPNIRIFCLIPCSVFSSRLPWQAHSRKRKPLPPQSPILNWESLVLSIHRSPSESTAQSHHLHLFPNAHSFPKLWGNFKRDERGHSPTFHQLSQPWPEHGGSPAPQPATNY